MRIQTALLLLVGSAAAFPSRFYGGRRLLPRGNDTKPVCEESFDTSKIKDDDKKLDFTKKQWEKVGGEDYLKKLMKKSPKDWSFRLFLDSELGGNSQTSSYSCTQLDQSLCGPTAKCSEYEPPAAFWVHTAMVNYFSFFAEMRETLQDIGIFQLATGIKDINEVFGPTPTDDTKGLFPILIGTFVLSAAAAGPVWQLGASMTAIVGVLNLAAGMHENSKTDPEVVEKDMEKTLGNVFGSFVDSLDQGVEGFFSGEFEDSDEDPKDFILKTFRDGTMVEEFPVDDAIDEWKENVRDMINQILIVQALKNEDYQLYRLDDIDKDECEDKGGVHFDDTCNRIGYHVEGTQGNLSSKPGSYRGLREKAYKALTEDWKVDYEKLLKNAAECDGKDPKMEDFAKHDKEDSFPPCLANFKVEHPDRSKCGFTGCSKYDE